MIRLFIMIINYDKSFVIRFFFYTFTKNKIMEQNKKQETLEEAAERHAEEHGSEERDPWFDFIEGAGWMKERMYSEEDMLKAYGCGRLNLISFRKFIETFKKK